ncbi:MAG: biotin--[acetyl-CoA-carboxylase] ligase [candidate division WOR-3 bacterium]
MQRQLLKFKQVASTQDVLKKLIKNKNEVAVFAYRQTKGRGRHNREWFSPLGGLYLSILIFPEKHPDLIPLIAALSVIEALKGFHFNNLAIHWPNDVILNNKKICGILCERDGKALICGIGLNVNIRKFPPKISNATSLFMETGRIYNLENLLNLILKNFWFFYDILQNDRFKIKDAYQYISGIGESVEIKLSSRKVIRGIIHNVDEDWGLLVRTEDGLIKRIYHGDVVRLS